MSALVKRFYSISDSNSSDDQEDAVLIPGLNGGTGNKYLYNITCEPQPGVNGRTYPLLAAHVVGGGTVINGMAFDRGSEGDYDLWENLGNLGWGWGGLLPYFKKVRFCKAKSTGNAFRSLQLSAERKLHFFTPEHRCRVWDSVWSYSTRV